MFIRIAAITLTLALCIAQTSSAQVRRIGLDATKGERSRHHIIYVTTAPSKASTKGSAIAMLYSEAKLDLSYGYYWDKGKAKVGTIDVERARQIGDETNPNLTITTVEVTQKQYAASKSIIEAIAKTENTVDAPPVIFYNCISQVLKACNMKVPYRSAYRAPNPVQWIGDIPAYSRDITVK